MTLFIHSKPHVRTQHIREPFLQKKHIQLDIRREDELHTYVSGNKYRKLKYNLIQAQKQGYTKVLTFGGAYSNHICAAACASYEMGLQSIGVIRGAELAQKWHENTTLTRAHEHGMAFEFVTRQDYKQKNEPAFLQFLQEKYGDCYVIPEGGTNKLAVKGCSEIISEQDLQTYDVICCAVGTGGTVAGIINSTIGTHIQVLGFSALKAASLLGDVAQFVEKNTDTWSLNFDYTFGGYAKTTEELWQFITDFEKQHYIPLEPIYTGKMLYGIYDLIAQGYFAPNTRILAIHTGGLQGLEGFKQRKKGNNSQDS